MCLYLYSIKYIIFTCKISPYNPNGKNAHGIYHKDILMLDQKLTATIYINLQYNTLYEFCYLSKL
jgi:hypothetical protein